MGDKLLDILFNDIGEYFQTILSDIYVMKESDTVWSATPNTDIESPWFLYPNMRNFDLTMLPGSKHYHLLFE